MPTLPSARLLKHSSTLVPALLALLGLVVLVRWASVGPAVTITSRVPGLDGAPPPVVAPAEVRPVPGEPARGPGKPAAFAAE
jgi:hypothetical protein